MCEVQLLYAANQITEEEKEGLTAQSLFFLVWVKNLAFAKKIDILWVGADGVWHTLPAMFHSMSAGDAEYWNVAATIQSTPDTPLPRNIHFAVRYQVNGREYWDDNGGLNYFSPVRSSLQRAGAASVLNLGAQQHLENGQSHALITVAVNDPFRARKVSIHWTTDDWEHTHVTHCQLQNRLVLSNGEHIVEDGAQIWTTLLDIGSSFRLQYSICCEYKNDILWDNNHGRNYSASRKPLNVLVLNLHCRQEDDQDHKFSQIAKAIDELYVDVVCLQEVAESWNDGQGDWQSNSARIINERLKQPYHVHTDWSHLGFDRYREGVAILSRYPIAEYDARYLSHCHDPYSIHSRKAVMGQIPIPYFGPINFFSVHTSWWDDGFPEQFQNLRDWARPRHNNGVSATLLCGDFNIEAGSKGYQFIVNSNDYDDEFLAVTSPEVFAKVFRRRHNDWQRYLIDDHRIDYVFMTKSSALRATAARFVFNHQEYGRVSDHEGLLITFEPA